VVVWLELRVNDRISRVLPVAMQVRAFGQQWVAREKLERNQVVTPKHFERREVEFRLPYRVAAVDVPARMRLLRDLQSGQTLEATDVFATHAVSRGDLVIAEIHSGRVSVRAAAESLQDGRLGQRVLVKVGGSAKPLFASVIEPGLVEVRR